MRKLLIPQMALDCHEATLGKALLTYLGKLTEGHKIVWGDKDQNGEYTNWYQAGTDEEKEYWKWVNGQVQDDHVLTALPLKALEFAKENQERLKSLPNQSKKIDSVSRALFAFDAWRALKVLRPANDEGKIRWSGADENVKEWNGWSLAAFVRLLDVRYCPYCNAETVGVVYAGMQGERESFSAIDHILPKGKYPLLALSLYNLVPACNRCNSQFKGAKDGFDLEKWDQGKPLAALHPYAHNIYKWFRFDYRPKDADHLFLNPQDKVSPLSATPMIPLKRKVPHRDAKFYFSRVQGYLDDYRLLNAYCGLYATEINEILKTEMVCTPTFIETMKAVYPGMCDEDFDLMFRRTSLDPREINKHRFAKLIIDLHKQIGSDDLSATYSKSHNEKDKAAGLNAGWEVRKRVIERRLRSTNQFPLLADNSERCKSSVRT